MLNAPITPVQEPFKVLPIVCPVVREMTTEEIAQQRARVRASLEKGHDLRAGSAIISERMMRA